MQVPFAKPASTAARPRRSPRSSRPAGCPRAHACRRSRRAFAARVGAAEAVATTNCTTALQLALYASGVGPGDEVIVPSLSFIATANAVWQCGATPVFADIDPRTYNLDPAAAEQAITPRTKAIMPVHQIGLPADMDAFSRSPTRTGSTIVEDAACAIGATLQGPPDRLAGLARLLLAAPAQGDHHRRGRHDHHATTPSSPSACASCASTPWTSRTSRATTRTDVVFETLSRARLEHAHDRHAGRARPLPARGARRDPRRAAPPGRRATTRRSRRSRILEAPYEPDYAVRTWQSYAVRVAPGCAGRRARS